MLLRDSETAPVAGQRFQTWADRLLVVCGGGLALFCLAQTLMLRFGRDQGIYAMVADVMLHGGMPYRDAWDFKPPGIYFVYALAQLLFGRNEWGIRLFEVLAFVATIPAFVVVARRYFGSAMPGLLAGFLAIVLESELEFWHTSQPESFGGLLTVVAIMLATADADMRGNRPKWQTVARWVGGGLLFGLAGLMKPQLAGGALITAVAVAWRLRKGGARPVALVWPIVTQLGGAALAVATCLLYFKARGAYADLYQALFVFAPQYGTTTWDSAWWPNFLYYAFEYFAVAGAGPLMIGLLLSVTLPSVADREREGLLVAGSILFLHLVGIAIQSKYFAYHFGATYVLGSMVAGLGLYKGWTIAKRHQELGVLVFLCLFYLFARARTATRDLGESYWDRSWQRTSAWWKSDAAGREDLADHLYSVADVDYGANRKLASWLQEHSGPNDSVYIWGFECHVYFVSGRKSASKFIYNVPQRASWGRDEARRDLMQELERNAPRIVVLAHNDVFPVVTGDSLDSGASLKTFPELRAFVDGRYRLATTIQDFDLYVRE